MLRAPAEIAFGLGAAQPLVERIAPGPFAELGRDRIGGDDLRLTMPGAETLCESARDAADRQPFDRRTEIARSHGRALEREDIKIGEILAVHERPANCFAP